MTSGSARARKWLLVFEPRSAPFLSPLMGWTGSCDPLTQVELTFPSREAAIAYAQSQGLHYTVEKDCGAVSDLRQKSTAACKQAFSDRMTSRLGLAAVQEEYAKALQDTDAHSDFQTPPMDVVHDPKLSKEAKREMLMKWAWDEYLAQSMLGGASDGSRLQEIERAIVALDGAASAPAVQSQVAA